MLWRLLAVAIFAHARHALLDRTVVQRAKGRALAAEIAPSNGACVAPIADTLSPRDVWPRRGLRGVVGHAGDAGERIDRVGAVGLGEEHGFVGLPCHI